MVWDVYQRIHWNKSYCGNPHGGTQTRDRNKSTYPLTRFVVFLTLAVANVDAQVFCLPFYIKAVSI